MAKNKRYIALDIGEKRIGVAAGDSQIKIAVPLGTIEVDGDELRQIAEYAVRDQIEAFIVGYPRNQSGEPTAQTAYVEEFSKNLTDIAPVIFQDESLTSVLATEQLQRSGRGYSKGDVDAGAAALILQDYLETLG